MKVISDERREGGARSRPPIVRMRRIHEALSEGARANCSRLARAMEVSTKTVQRDLDYMRDQLELPIEYDASNRSYYYARPVKTFPGFEVTEGDLLALFVARESLESCAGGRFEEMLRRTFAKLTSRLSDSVVFEWESLAARVEFHQAKPRMPNLQAYGRVSRAVTEGRRLRFKYRGLQDRSAKTRTLQPYQLRFVDGGWYVVGWDEVRRDWRVFALSRMSDVQVLPQSFERDESFDTAAFWSGTLGVYREGKKEKVVLRFRDWAARVAAEREWHSSQRTRLMRSGEVELSLTVQVTPELLRWILSWADAVEVRSPARLRREIGRIGGRMARNNK